MRRIRSGCCARATSGHAAAAPAMSVMNSRRPMLALLRLRRHINHLALLGALVQHGSNRANRGIKLFVRHVLKALGMLNPHFLRHQHCADLEIAGRTFPAHPLKHLAPMQLPILRQIGEKVLVKRPPRSLW
jgi:hypothetical protein